MILPTLAARAEEASGADDGLAPGVLKGWLTVENGKSSWVEVAFPMLIYVNGYPRVFAWPGDRVSASISRTGRQSIRVSRARSLKAPLPEAPNE